MVYSPKYIMSDGAIEVYMNMSAQGNIRRQDTAGTNDRTFTDIDPFRPFHTGMNDRFSRKAD